MTRNEALDAIIARTDPDAVRDAVDVAQMVADLCTVLKKDSLPASPVVSLP